MSRDANWDYRVAIVVLVVAFLWLAIAIARHLREEARVDAEHRAKMRQRPMTSRRKY